jgi:hypothetical protein
MTNIVGFVAGRMTAQQYNKESSAPSETYGESSTEPLRVIRRGRGCLTEAA